MKNSNYSAYLVAKWVYLGYFPYELASKGLISAGAKRVQESEKIRRKTTESANDRFLRNKTVKGVSERTGRRVGKTAGEAISHRKITLNLLNVNSTYESTKTSRL